MFAENEIWHFIMVRFPLHYFCTSNVAMFSAMMHNDLFQMPLSFLRVSRMRLLCKKCRACPKSTTQWRVILSTPFSVDWKHGWFIRQHVDIEFTVIVALCNQFTGLPSTWIESIVWVALFNCLSLLFILRW